MTTTAEVHCSACDAIVAPGQRFCPGCGLQLTAEAKLATYVEEPRFSLVATLGIGILLFIVACNVWTRAGGVAAAFTGVASVLLVGWMAISKITVRRS